MDMTNGKALDILTNLSMKAAIEMDRLKTDESAKEANLIREAMHRIQWTVSGVTSAYGREIFEDLERNER